MSTLTEVSEFTATVNKIDDGEDITEALLNDAPQSLANRTNYLNTIKAPLESPAFTGIPTAPTAADGTSTTQIATTAFVAGKDGTATPIAAAETASVGVSKKLAREDHVHPSNLSSSASDIKMDGTQSAGISTKPSRADHVHPTDTTRAPIVSPAFTGTPTAPTPSSGDATTKLATTAFVINNGLPAGSIIYTARPTPPVGYLKANGAAIGREAYAALFAAIGTIYGSGDGSTTFNLPDLRGMFIRGLDEYRGVDPYYYRTIGSRQEHSVQDHAHTVNTPLLITDNDRGGASSVWSVDDVQTNWTGGMANGNASTETRPVNLAFMVCIKY